jgi:hypothetical protein
VQLSPIVAPLPQRMQKMGHPACLLGLLTFGAAIYDECQSHGLAYDLPRNAAILEWSVLHLVQTD